MPECFFYFRLCGWDRPPEIDLSERKQCFSILERISPDIIINCAAFTAVDACETDPSCWKANRDIPGHLAQWANKMKPFSSMCQPTMCSRGIVRFLRLIMKEFRHVQYPYMENPSRLVSRLLLRKPNAMRFYEPHGCMVATGIIFLRTMLRLTLQNSGKEYKVVDDQWGSPTPALTLAYQIRAVIEEEVTGIFHASSEGYCTWYTLACEFLDNLNIRHNFIPCESTEFPTMARRPTNSILENSRLKKLGINQFTDWKNELENFSNCFGKSMVQELKVN